MTRLEDQQSPSVIGVPAISAQNRGTTSSNLEKLTTKIAIKTNLHTLETAQANIIKRKFERCGLEITRVYRDDAGRAVVLLNVSHLPNTLRDALEILTVEFDWMFSRYNGTQFLRLTYKAPSEDERHHSQQLLLADIN